MRSLLGMVQPPQRVAHRFSVSVYRIGAASAHTSIQRNKKSKAKEKKNEQHAHTKLEKGKEFVCLCFLFLSYRFKNADKKSLHSLTVHAQFYVRFTLLMPSLTPSGHVEPFMLAFSVGIEQHIWLKKWNKDIGLKGVFFLSVKSAISFTVLLTPLSLRIETYFTNFRFYFFSGDAQQQCRGRKIRINE